MFVRTLKSSWINGFGTNVKTDESEFCEKKITFTNWKRQNYA